MNKYTVELTGLEIYLIQSALRFTTEYGYCDLPEEMLEDYHGMHDLDKRLIELTGD